MLKVIITAACLLSTSAFATSNPRIDPTHKHIYSSRSSCSGMRSAISTHGAAIVHYGHGLYERVVAHSGYCSDHSDTTRPFYVGSADRANCFAGYTCESNNGGF